MKVCLYICLLLLHTKMDRFVKILHTNRLTIDQEELLSPTQVLPYVNPLILIKILQWSTKAK